MDSQTHPTIAEIPAEQTGAALLVGLLNLHIRPDLVVLRMDPKTVQSVRKREIVNLLNFEQIPFLELLTGGMNLTQFLRSWMPARVTWESGQKVVVYSAGSAGPYDPEKYDFRYPLREWNWKQEECSLAIRYSRLLRSAPIKHPLPSTP